MCKEQCVVMLLLPVYRAQYLVWAKKIARENLLLEVGDINGTACRCVFACHALKYPSLFSLTEHKCFVDSRKMEEDRRARHNLRRRSINKKELLEMFRRRRLQNFIAEERVAGTFREQPTPPPSRKEPRRRLTEPLKDWAFYKRNGFVWSDLGCTPKSRLALVVPPIAIKRDRECMERLLSKVEEEEMAAAEHVRQRRDRVAAQRERWLAKVSSSTLLV